MTDTITDTTAGPAGADGRNDAFDWEGFNPADYHRHNYEQLRADDAAILRIVARHFARTPVIGLCRRGIDVGSGSNLAPALALAAYCETITLYEHSAANVSWLHNELRELPETWEPFFDIAAAPDDRLRLRWEASKTRLGAITSIQQRSIFDLPPASWDIGTMFFCAESVTADPGEFEIGLGRFLRALTALAPFAAVFMENSCGYSVGEGARRRRFPAVAIDQAKLAATFDRIGVTDVEITRVEIDPAPIRAGYTGYLVATGLS